MVKKVTDNEISEKFNVARSNITRWKKDPIKYPMRYDLYKLGTLLIVNDIDFEDVVHHLEKNRKLRKEIKEMLEHVKGLT